MCLHFSTGLVGDYLGDDLFEALSATFQYVFDLPTVQHIKPTCSCRDDLPKPTVVAVPDESQSEASGVAVEPLEDYTAGRRKAEAKPAVRHSNRMR